MKCLPLSILAAIVTLPAYAASPYDGDYTGVTTGGGGGRCTAGRPVKLSVTDNRVHATGDNTPDHGAPIDEHGHFGWSFMAPANGTIPPATITYDGTAQPGKLTGTVNARGTFACTFDFTAERHGS